MTATVEKEYEDSRYILDGGRDLLLQQKRAIDGGELEDIARKFQVIFRSLNSKYASFLVHKNFVPFLGQVVGELVKIRFPRKRKKPLEWMGRVVIIEEKNLNYWWDEGFDSESSDEVFMCLEFQEMPEYMRAQVIKALEQKNKKIKRVQHITFFKRLMQELVKNSYKAFKYAVFAIIVILVGMFLLEPKLDKFLKNVSKMGELVVDHEKQKQLSQDLVQQVLGRLSAIDQLDDGQSPARNGTLAKRQPSTELDAKQLAKLRAELEEYGGDKFKNLTDEQEKMLKARQQYLESILEAQ